MWNYRHFSVGFTDENAHYIYHHISVMCTIAVLRSMQHKTENRRKWLLHSACFSLMTFFSAVKNSTFHLFLLRQFTTRNRTVSFWCDLNFVSWKVYAYNTFIVLLAKVPSAVEILDFSFSCHTKSRILVNINVSILTSKKKTNGRR